MRRDTKELDGECKCGYVQIDFLKVGCHEQADI